MATGLHGGLLFAFADQIGASSKTKTQTEISILDLPSVSGTTQLDAKPVKKIQQNLNTGLKPIKEKEAKTLEDSSQKHAVQRAANSAKVIEKANEGSAANIIKAASLIKPVTSTKSTNNRVTNTANLTAPIENQHETSETIASNRITKAISPAAIAPNLQPIITETQSVEAEVLNSQKNITNNLQPSQLAQPSKITKTIKTAKLTTGNDKTRARPTVTNTTISKTTSQAKITPASVPILKKPNSLKTVARVHKSKAKSIKSDPEKIKVTKAKTSSLAAISAKAVKPNIQKTSTSIQTARIKTIKPNVKSTVTTTQKLNITKAEASNPAVISTKAVKSNTQKSNVIKRIDHIQTVRSRTKEGKQITPKNTSVRIAILARPKQITPNFQQLPTVNQTDGFSKVVNFLKFYSSENACFLALPSISNQEKIELSGFSNEKNSWPRFQIALAQNTKFKVAGRLASISDAQCQVITFARQSSSYPSYSISMKLDYSSIKNGEFIAGKLFFDEGQYFVLLLVDDEGTAINLNEYVTVGMDESSFQLQINLTSGEVSTSQLLLAIVTDKLLNSARSQAPTPANDLLQNIKAEIEARNINMDLALTAFKVK